MQHTLELAAKHGWPAVFLLGAAAFLANSDVDLHIRRQAERPVAPAQTADVADRQLSVEARSPKRDGRDR